MEEEQREEISLEARYKEALRKANQVREYVSDRNDGCEPSVAECLAYDMQYVKRYVENLLEENEKLENEKQNYFEKYQYHLKQNESLTREFSDYIPILVIQNKIDEIKQDKNCKYYDMFLETRDIEETISILQELLNERNK